MATGVFTEIFELVRGLNQQRLAALAETSGIPQHLQSMLRQGSIPARLQAAETLVWFPSRESRAVLFEALSDRNDDVSLAAATCLADWHIEFPSRSCSKLERTASAGVPSVSRHCSHA
jgi:hypothetical protein